MKALTVQQPWATAIVHWGKCPENRSRNIAGAYRGPLAIHAGKVEDEAAYDDDMIRDALGTYDDSWRLLDHLETRGAIIGMVDLVAVHHDSQHGADRCSPWAQWGQWHLVLANPRPLAEPVPCRGALGIWTPYVATVHYKLEDDGCVMELGIFPTESAAKARCKNLIQSAIRWTDLGGGGAEGNGIFPEVFTVCPWEPGPGVAT